MPSFSKFVVFMCIYFVDFVILLYYYEKTLKSYCITITVL